ncbi:hypothetical protein SAMN04488021_1912 [Paracoccus aminovorans]|uniref:Uncharacterized protein n=1 Tax=Paracoccus aminovorans TaxID=34004 RepID=A0A1I3FNV1_9RHOB|nr:hypothetical protein JCM7685_3042 [Paracoccus aminovorans]SFI12879.1 hypothetical protein SAMN04488021_1912 [Paracoccus aminovorans]
MGIEHHLLCLARIGPHEEHPAVARANRLPIDGLIDERNIVGLSQRRGRCSLRRPVDIAAHGAGRRGRGDRHGNAGIDRQPRGQPIRQPADQRRRIRRDTGRCREHRRVFGGQLVDDGHHRSRTACRVRSRSPSRNGSHASSGARSRTSVSATGSCCRAGSTATGEASSSAIRRDQNVSSQFLPAAKTRRMVTVSVPTTKAMVRRRSKPRMRRPGRMSERRCPMRPGRR